MFDKIKKKFKKRKADDKATLSESSSSRQDPKVGPPISTDPLDEFGPDRSMRRPGETVEQAQSRFIEEFVDHWKDKEPDQASHQVGYDRITDLIFTGRSNKPKTDTTSPTATPHDRTTALIEQALENLWTPKPQPTHQVVEIDRTALGSFKYEQRLGTDSIRLLHFHENEYQLPDFGRDQKICTMEAFPLDEAPAFLTLSYAWKSPRIDEHTIESYAEPREWFVRQDGQDCRVEIGRNLYEGLQRITKAFTSTRYIWIDALCINQDDLEERASQVSIMGDIYSRCVKVVIWLGEMEATEAAEIWTLHFDLLPEIVKYVGTHGGEAIRTGDWTEEDIRERFNLSERSIGEKQWKAYARFFKQTMWFHRVWVVQEVAMSPQAVVLWGHLNLPWMEMVLLARFLSATGLSQSIPDLMIDSDSDEPSIAAGTVIGAMNGLLSLATSMKNPSGSVTIPEHMRGVDSSQIAWRAFLECLSMMRSLDSTDPRDRIFAALGILQIDRSKAGIIIPDYSKTKTTEMVFTDAVAVVLRELPGLDILAMREDDEQRSHWNGLPSWVPDFTVKKGQTLRKEAQSTTNASQPLDWADEDPAILLQRMRAARGEHSVILEPRVTPPRSPNWKLSGTTLVLQGSVVDTVLELHPWHKIGRTHAADAQSLAVLKVWFDAVRHLNTYSTYEEDPLEVLWRTLIADRTNVPEEPQIDSSCFRAFVAWLAIETVEQVAQETNGETNIHPKLICGDFPESDAKPSPNWLEFLQATQARIRTSLYPTAEDIEVLDTLHKKSSLFLTTASKYMTNRQLYVTASGLVGLGPVSMREGDAILCVKDSRLVFVVRPAGGDYEMVGETYLHGRMEAISTMAKYGLGPMWSDVRLC